MGAGQADVFRPHDLVSRVILEHAVLVDPRSCAKAFSPMMALLRGMGMPVMLETRRLAGYSRVVSMPVRKRK